MEPLELCFSSGSSSDPSLIHFLDAHTELAASVLKEYPSVFDTKGGGESLWVEAKGKVVSHVASVVAKFHHPLYSFPVGLVGSVVTQPEFRGMGLATSLMRQALEKLKAKGCLVAALWSNNTDFYTPVGFHPAGREMEFVFDEPVGTAQMAVEECNANGDTVAQLSRLYHQHHLGLERSLDRFAQLLQVPNVRCFIVRESGLISAYAVLNKGSDFQDVIHEWAGHPAHLAAIVRHLKNSDYVGKRLRMIGPAHKPVAEIAALSSGFSVGSMALVKVLDRSSIKSIYLSYLRNQGVEANWGEALIVDGLKLRTDTDAEFLNAVFGQGLDGETHRLPFFVWGLDSV
jgi:GNAT superfamily N-acetyltransferase